MKCKHDARWLVPLLALLLTWQDNGGSGFRIYRKDCNPGGQQCTEYRPIATLEPKTVKFIDQDVRGNRVFCYKVAALLDGGKEAFSNEDCAKNPSSGSDVADDPGDRGGGPKRAGDLIK